MVNKKTKKKRRAPLARLVFFIILILAIGFFIFYSIDNPQFIKNLFNMEQSGEEENISIPEDTIEDGASQEMTDEAVSGETGSSETSAEAASEEDTITEKQLGPLSLWQRILAFFTSRANASGGKDTYDSRITINIYFAKTGEEKILAAEERSIIAGNPGNALISAMNEILKGPVKSYHFPVIPAGTKLLGARALEGVAEIDLSKEFLENSLDSRILDEYIIYSIVNTVTEIPGINGVLFFLEGKRIKIYGDIDLSIPLIRDPDFLGEDNK